MKLGLLADVHEHVEHLEAALQNFREQAVDQVLVLGDVFGQGKRLKETCRLLAEAKAVGVWGNHDYGLCAEPDAEMLRRYGKKVIDYLTSFRGRLDRDGCHFTHVEPWLDPENILDLWYFDGPPDSAEKRDRIFKMPYRLMFGGHYHRWLLVAPHTIHAWQGEGPVSLSEGRYFIVIGALCDGCSAIFETETSLLTPFNRP